MKTQKQIAVRNFESRKGFIHHYQKLIKEVVIPYQYAVLHDQVEGVEKSHVVANFENAAKAVRGENPGDGFYGMVFQDSDAAKWIEAAAYSLSVFMDIYIPIIPSKIKKSAGLICWKAMSFIVPDI